jgi:hypothetical protein
MAHAEAADVIARWGKDASVLTDATISLINIRLDDVERMIVRRFKGAVPARDLEAEITALTLDVEDLKQVEADAVLRLVKNREGYVSETDGSYTYMLNQQIASGVLEIQPTEWQTLGLLNDGMFVIIPTPVMPT